MTNESSGFSPTAVKGCESIVFFHGVQMGRWTVSGADRWWENVCLGCISETLRCSKLILGGGIVLGCRCANSRCNLNLPFNLAVVNLTFKIFSGLYFINCKV